MGTDTLASEVVPERRSVQKAILLRSGLVAVGNKSIRPHGSYNSVFLSSVNDVLFTQWSVNDTFSNGSSVVRLIEDLQRGLITAEGVTPIDVAFMHGRWWGGS